MSVAVIADPDLRERVRCVRIIAHQTPMSALGVATWEELEQTFEPELELGLGLVVYARSLPGAPADAIERMLPRTGQLLLGIEPGENASPLPGVTLATRPIPEETLVLLARASGHQSTAFRMSFKPVDFIQMIGMSGDSQVIVLSHDGADAGVIELRSGEIWTAFDALGVGEAAFARLIRPELRARISPKNGSTQPRTIFKGVQELVLESMRRIDEGQAPLPPKLSAGKLEAALSSHEQIADRVRDLSAEARRLLMTRSYDAAARTLILLAELDPSSHLVRANLEQLRRLGYPK